MLKSIAFLTSFNYESTLAKCPDFLDEFNVLQPIFRKYEVNLIKTDWRDPLIDWKSFSAIIPKACWDYMLYPTEFEAFLKKIITLNTPMKNDINIVLWNMRKTYLLDLQKLNLPVAEFLLIPQYHNGEISTIVEQLHNANFQTTILVAKPSISGGASDTIRFYLNDIHLHEALFKKIFSYADLILQPYFPEIAETGEYSYFFFNKQFSHAILKKPERGDYRAHQLFGAQNLSYQPSVDEVEQALRFVSTVQPQCEYARIDVFKRNNQLFLIELELIEPYLYFERAPQSSLYAFCEAIIK